MSPRPEPTPGGAPPADLGGYARRGLGAQTRAGILLAGLGAAVAALAPTGEIVRGESALGFGEVTQEADAAITVVALVAMALLLAAGLAPWAWAHYAGIGLGAGLAGFCLFLIVGARNSDEFRSGAELTLLGGGRLLVAGSVIAMGGVVVALVGARAGEPPDPARIAAAAGTSGKAVAALVLGIASFVLGTVTAALAITFATRAAIDMRAAEGRLGGRGAAIGGLVCGVVFLVLWYLGFLALALFVEPSAD